MARARHAGERVRYVLFIILAVLTTAALAFRFPWQEEQSDGSERKQSKIGSTYLDTINRGTELHVSDSDFEESPLAESGTNLMSKNSSKKPGELRQTESIGAYRIQCMASQSLEGVRKEQQRMQQKLGLPLYIVYSPPFYRLHAGAFQSRDEAGKHLGEVQENGYPEAWVVESDAEPLE